MGGLYRGIWRYASLSDLLAIGRAVTIALLIFLPITFIFNRLDSVPRGSLVITWFVLIFLLGAPRMLYRIFKDRGFDHLFDRNVHKRVPVLLIGAGDNAEVFVREMARDRDAPYEVFGIVDEKGTRVGRQIHGVPVLGLLEDLADIVETLDHAGRMPQRLILTKRLDHGESDRALELANAKGISIARLPRLAEIEGDNSQRLEPRPVAIEDLLGRPQLLLDRDAMRRLIEGRRVLITGAGGSIGSELVRQVAGFQPAHLSLLDNSEHLLYAIGLDLDETRASLSRRTVLVDVRHRSRLEAVMAAERPSLVFHAAALKHVPLVQSNPLEGVLTNVIGTRNVATACRAVGAAAMVLISTDKAINPTSIMGATKRLAESYCQALDIVERRRGAAGTRFITVRFGNVLGSTGSVVPLFQRQLDAGGPLTVTDPGMTRFFMTIREAVKLVLQASALGVAGADREAGKIYVLDMGEPIKIIDLARQMIRLAGLHPDTDIEIKIVGLRPGEKLHEELFHQSEILIPTANPGLRLASPRTVDLELLDRSFDELSALAAHCQDQLVLAMIHRLVPEFSDPALSSSVSADHDTEADGTAVASGAAS